MTKNIASNYNFMYKHPAKIIKYKNYSDSIVLNCLLCGWNGTVKESGTVESNSSCVTVECPCCEKMLLIAEFPMAD